MKKFLLTMLALLLLVVGVGAALPWIVSPDMIRKEVAAQVSKATGRDFSFGAVKFVLWPDLGLELKDAVLGNPSWAKEKDMMTLESVDVQLALKPLLQREVVVKKFVLNKPVIHLEIGTDGEASWNFARTTVAAPDGGAGISVDRQDFSLKPGEVQIKEGKLTFSDRRKKTSESVESVNLTASLADLASPLRVESDFFFRGKKAELELDIAIPVDMLGGKKSPGSLRFKTEDADFKVDGVFSKYDILPDGKVDADILSPAKLLAWLTGEPEKAVPFRRVSFTSRVQVAGDMLKLLDATLAFDDMRAEGGVDVRFGKKPEVIAKLSVGKLDIDRFIDAAKAVPPSGGGAEPKQAEEDADTPVDFSGLNGFDAALDLKTGGFTLKGVETGACDIFVSVKEGNLRFKSSGADLLEGKFSSDVTIVQNPNTVTVKFSMAGVQAKPVLAAFADFKKLSGKVDASVNVTTFGTSKKALIKNMGGNGSIMFKNGALEGINLVSIASMLQKKFDQVGLGDGKTEFVTMGGTFTMVSGIANNADFSLQGPLVKATGAGEVNFPEQTLKYRIIPVLTATADPNAASFLSIPVDIKGPFDNLKVRPDYASVLQKAVSDPEAVKETIKNLKGQGKTLEQEIKSIKKDPGKLLNVLTGKSSLFGKPATVKTPEPTPAPVEPVPQPVPQQAPTPEVVPAPVQEPPPVEEPAPVVQPAPAEEQPPALPSEEQKETAP